MAKTPSELMCAARDRTGKTQAQIAEELGVTQPCVQRWEAGDAHPKSADIRRVAKAYGLRPEQLLPAEESKAS